MMRGPVRCVIYFALIGVSGFFLGRVLPKGLLRYDRFPFRAFGWERQGRIYEALGVRKWKDRVPDMSVILPKLMPSRKLPEKLTADKLELLLRETCVAELIHGLLCAAGFGCVILWRGVWGWTVSVLYFLANVPFMIIQRYNRPKLARILQRVRAKESVHEKCDDFELQHGTGS